MQQTILQKTSSLLKNKRLIFSITLFALVFILLGIPFVNWWFNGCDDFHGLYLAYKAKTWKDLFYFFYEGNIAKDMGPSNFIKNPGRPDFFSTYYRPLYCVYLTLQYWLFGTNGYYYFLTNIFFHTINTVILFNIFLCFIGYFPAFLTAMAFATHPQIAYRFGAIVNLHYYINVMFILLTLLLFKKYLDSKKLKYYLFAGTTFALSLFTRESSIVLPVIIFLGMFLYPDPTKFKFPGLKSFFQQFIKNIKLTFGFAVIANGFLALRLFLYPLKLTSSNNPTPSLYSSWLRIINNPSFSLLNSIKSRIPEFKVFIYDLLHLSWLPWGQKTIRGIIVISILSLLCWLFIKNKNKVHILYFLFCGIFMIWPVLRVPYSPRYFYEGHPFFLMAFIFLFKFSPSSKSIKKSFLFLLSLLIIFQTYFTLESFSRRERKMLTFSTALKELVVNPKIKNKAICPIGYPMDGLGDQFAGILWVMLDDPTIPAYFDTSTIITQLDSNLVKPTRWRNIISEYYSENFIKIKPITLSPGYRSHVVNGFRLTSTNPQKVAFNLKNNGFSLGKKITHKKQIINGEEMVTDFSLIFDEKYLDQDIVFITWDFKTQRFAFLNSSSINKSKTS